MTKDTSDTSGTTGRAAAYRGPADARAAGYRAPAEWSAHAACISAWPAHAYAWGEHLEAAQREVAAFLHCVAERDGSEGIELLCASEEAEAQARDALSALGERVRYMRMDYGDVWLRDIGPLFLCRGQAAGEPAPDHSPTRNAAQVAALCFGFNGWGHKYVYPHDDRVAGALAVAHGLPRFDVPYVIEGGALEVDGEGTCLTTVSCLLNHNRNPGVSRAEMERALGDALAVDKVLWLDEGLAGDHTDGHIDNLARFAAPGVVLHMRASDGADAEQDPNRDVLAGIEARLREFTDARGRALTLIPVPSVGAVLDADGEPMAASYMNFYIGNRVVVVPAFGSPHDEAARRAIAAAFPTRETVSCSARAVLEGGGTFHCITRQRPEVQPWVAC